MRPRVHLNCAATLDGKLAAPDGERMRLSDETDWRRVHHLRAESDAILVGVGTIVQDNPGLKVDPDHAPVPFGRKLLRVVLDTKGRTPAGSKVLDGSAPSLILHGPGVKRSWGHADHAEVPLGGTAASGSGAFGGGSTGLDLGACMDVLGDRGVRYLMVEGGAQVLRAFLSTDLVERWTLYTAPVLVGGSGPSIWDGRPTAFGRRLHVEHVEKQGKGVLWTFRP